MGLASGGSQNAKGTQKAGKSSSQQFGVVYSVVLDENHPQIKELGKDLSIIGCVEFRSPGQLASDDESLTLAYPYDSLEKDLPLRNESVELIQSGGRTYYRRIGIGTTPNITSGEKTIASTFTPREDRGQSTRQYSKVQATGIARAGGGDYSKHDGYGDYYTPQQNIHKLKLYEGDRLLETRFGQSLRFTAYNNDDKEFSPVVILRNAESGISRSEARNAAIEEDINRDGTIIVLGSNQYQLGFQPGTVDRNGTSDFETKPNSFSDYPSTLIGDQLLLNSGRIILSVKNAEMIFYSKKNYGFISDGGLSIDNKFGITANVGDDINITTNDRSVNINSGNGNINLGNNDLESLVRGETLVEVLGELIDAINAQTFLTPSGPTKVGPENLPTFNSIKSKLNSILSTLNKTS